MNFNNVFSSDSRNKGSHNPFQIYQHSSPDPNGITRMPTSHTEPLDSFRIELRVFPARAQKDYHTISKIINPNTTLTNIKTIMNAIVQSFPDAIVHSAQGNGSLNQPMVTYPDDPAAAASFFNIDRSEINAKGYGYVSAFFKN
jgi:hypothetical protein